MFTFLKEKIKSAIASFSKKAEEGKEEISEIPAETKREEKVQESQQKKEKPQKVFKPKEKKGKEVFEEKKEQAIEEPKKEVPEKIHGGKKSFFQRFTEKISTVKVSKEKFDMLFNDLEVALLENNVAVEVIDKIRKDLEEKIVDHPYKRKNVETVVTETLKESLEEVLDQESVDLLYLIKEKKEKPFIIVFFGINGTGKTTTIGKIASLLKKHKLNCVLAASDTFRAGAQEQLQEWSKNLGVAFIKGDYGADPTSVAFNAVTMARSRNIDVVLIDTAGRMHTNRNLIGELQKITRVIKPDLKLFVGESIAGNDCIEQVKMFNDAIGIDGIILSKADVDEKGGTALSVKYVTGKPILYLGIGQKDSDLEIFNKEKIVASIGV